MSVPFRSGGSFGSAAGAWRRARIARSVAASAALIAAGVAVAASWRATHPAPPPALSLEAPHTVDSALAVAAAGRADGQRLRVPRERAAPGGGGEPITTDPTTASPVAAIVALNPFSAERRPPSVRFRMPGDEAPAPPAAATDAAPAPEVRLVGTVVGTGGRSFAVCQAGAEPARVVRVGERVGDLKLRSVERGGATFADPAGRPVKLFVPKAGG